MNIWLKTLFTFLVIFPSLAYPEDEELLQEFNIDAFFSEKLNPPESHDLVGRSFFSSIDEEDTYIINFNSTPVVEYIRFVGKIANVNFQFEEAELNFTISVIANEPLTVPNIVSALIQTLEARGFSVLEQDNNLLITASREINQIATIVTPTSKDKGDKAPKV